MQRLILLTIFLFSAAFSYAQFNDSIPSNPFLATFTYWKKGEQKTYIIEDKKFSYRNDSLIKEETTSKAEYLVKVADSTATQYKMIWRIGKNLKPIDEDFPKEAMAAIEQKYQDIDLHYTINTDGQLETYDNKPHIDSVIVDIKKSIYPYFNKMFKQKGIVMSDEKLAKFMNNILSPEVFFNFMYGSKVSNFHYFYKIPVNLIDTTTEEVFFKLPKGGQIPAASYTYISYSDTTTNEVAFVVEQLADSEIFTAFVKGKTIENIDAFKKALSRKERKKSNYRNKKVVESMKDFQVYWWQKLTFVVNYATGWPEKITFTKVITAIDKDDNIDEQVEETTYDLQK